MPAQRTPAMLALEALEPRAMLAHFADVGINVFPEHAHALALAPIVGDPAADLLVVQNQHARTLMLKANRGDGTFAPARTLLTLDGDAAWIGAATGRFDADRRADIVVAYEVGGQRFLRLLRGGAAGAFTAAPEQALPSDVGFTRIDGARLEGAARPCWLVLGSTVARFDDGRGVFDLEHVALLDSAPSPPVVGDTDGDHRDELVVIIPASGTGDAATPSFLGIVTRETDGSWTARTVGQLSTGSYVSVTIGDATRDGLPDLVASATSFSGYGATVQLISSRLVEGLQRWRLPRAIWSTVGGDNSLYSVQVRGLGLVAPGQPGIGVSVYSVYQGRMLPWNQTLGVLVPAAAGAWSLDGIAGAFGYEFGPSGLPPQDFVLADVNRDGFLDAAVLRQVPGIGLGGSGRGDAATIWQNLPVAPGDTSAAFPEVAMGALNSSGSRAIEVAADDPDGGVISVWFALDLSGNGRLDSGDPAVALTPVAGRPGVFRGGLRVPSRYFRPGPASVIVQTVDRRGFMTLRSLVINLP